VKGVISLKVRILGSKGQFHNKFKVDFILT
jgi:hypothetical protein